MYQTLPYTVPMTVDGRRVVRVRAGCISPAKVAARLYLATQDVRIVAQGTGWIVYAEGR